MLKYLKKTYIGLILLFLYAPIFVLMVFSFNQSKSSAHFTGFTLKWYVEIFKDSVLLEALMYTVVIAVISTVVATIVGTAAAVGINSMSRINKKIILNISSIPVMIPEVVMGVSLMMLFLSFVNIFHFGNLGFITMLLAHITFNIPYVILSVLPKLRQLDENLYEAALDLGAKPLFSFRKIILPEIMPGIITGALLAFTMSIDDFIISYFTAGSNVSNLSIYIYTSRRGINPKINALSTLMFLTVILLLYIINKRGSLSGGRNGNKKDKGDGILYEI